MKTKTPKARVMWANPIDLKDDGYSSLRLTRTRDIRATSQTIKRVLVIDADDVEAMVERAAIELYIAALGPQAVPYDGRALWVRDTYRAQARAALAAIGIPITPARAKGRKGAKS